MTVYKWIVSYLRPYLGKLALFIGCGLLVTTIELSITRFIQYFIDTVVPERQTERFLWLLAALSLSVVVMVAAQAWRNMLQRIIQEQASKDLMFQLFRHLRKLGFSYYEQHPVGETIGLFHTEVAAVQRMFRQYVPNLIQYTLTLAVLLGFVIQLSWKLSLWIVPFFFSYYVIGPYFERKATLWSKESNRERRLSSKQVYDSVAALHEVRAYGSERWNIGRLVSQYESLHATQLKQYLYGYLRGTVRRVATGLGAAAMFAYGIKLVQDGEMAVGAFIVFSIFYFRVMYLMTIIVTLSTEQKIVLQQAEVLYDVMHRPPAVKETESPVRLTGLRGEIEFRHVRFGYPGRPDVLRGLTFRAEAGRKAALVGASGGGKSTVLKLIARFYDPAEGEVLLDGVPVNRLSLEQLRSAIGYVFQETYLFGGTVRDNIRFGFPEASDSDIEAAAKAAYAHEFIKQLPQGYDTVVGERGIKLSGGQKQRIAIARMFVKNPSIVLLDEATSALDTISEKEVQLALDSLLEGRTTITVAHRLSTVKQYDLLIVLEDGVNAEQGSYQELFDRRGLLYELVQGAGAGSAAGSGSASERRAAYE